MLQETVLIFTNQLLNKGPPQTEQENKQCWRDETNGLNTSVQASYNICVWALQNNLVLRPRDRKRTTWNVCRFMPLQVWMLQLKVIQKANKCTVLSELVKDKVKSTVPAPYLSNTLYAALGIELKSILEIEKNQWWTSKWKKAFQNSERSKKQDLYSLGNRSKADLLKRQKNLNERNEKLLHTQPHVDTQRRES